MRLRRLVVPVAALVASAAVLVPLGVLDAAPARADGPVDVAFLYRSSPDASPEVRVRTAPNAASAQQLLDELSTDPDVMAASVDATAHTLEISGGAPVPTVPLATSDAAATSDPRSADQWALTRLDASAAWERGIGEGQVVAVLDTGVDASHPDLAGQVLAGFDAYNPNGNGQNDPNGHGTHVAGIIASVRDNGQGGSGLAPGSKILPVRVLDENGSGDHADIARGTIWAADHGATVINMSLGGPEDSDVLRQAVTYARSRGVVVIVAAGNSAIQGNPVIYPAAYGDVVSVAASSPGDSRAIFSTFGPYVDVTAPGLSILSTYPDAQYAYLSGTSMASPYVAAAAALVRQSYPGMSATDVSNRLSSSAQDLGAAGRDDQFGAGMVDPLAARTDGVARPAPAPDPSNPQLPTPRLPNPSLPNPNLPTLPKPTLPDLPRPSLPKPSLPGNPAPSLPPLPGNPSPSLPRGNFPGLPEQPGMSISAAPRSVNAGAATVITGAVALVPDARSGIGVELAARVSGTRSYTVVASSTTDASGRVAFSARPPRGTDFIIRLTSGEDSGTTSAAVHVDVSPVITVTTERSKGAVTLSGKVSPATGGTVQIQQLRSGRWVTTGSVKVDRSGSFSSRTTPKSGASMIRAHRPQSEGYAAASSKPVSLLS